MADSRSEPAEQGEVKSGAGPIAREPVSRVSQAEPHPAQDGTGEGAHDPRQESRQESSAAPRLQLVAGRKSPEGALGADPGVPTVPPASRRLFPTWAVLLLSLVALLATVTWFAARPRADIALEVRSGESLIIRGLVLYQGQPVDTGKIQLVVTDAKTTYHLASVVRDVARGEFATDAAPAVALMNLEGDRQLRIVARFWGRTAPGEGRSAEPLETETTVYSNCSSPIMREDVTRALISFGVLAGLVIVLFTVELTQLWARVLFGASYLSTFLSVTLPLVLIVYVSQNPYLMEIMKDSPVGLVRARTQLATTDAEWLLNVGGLVTSVPNPQAPGITAEAVPAAPAPAPLVGVLEGPPVAEATADLALPKAAMALESDPLPPQALVVTGGLAIPFYVILLAVFGAGINMMRRIPSIQSKHMMRLHTTSTAGAAKSALPAPAPGDTDASCDIRQEVIAQHMYLLAAPFLAIAVYYLLQILAQDIAQPVIVLMSFSAGLISERIVAAVIGVAERTLGGKDEEGDEAHGAKDKPADA